MPLRFRLSLGLALALAASALPSSGLARMPEREAEEVELVAAAGLQPVGRGDGDIFRYVLRRPYHRNARLTARIVQVHWPYEAEHPRVLLLELATPDGTAATEWRITERREALMAPSQFNRLIGNVAAAASVVGARTDRVLVCSHAASSRFDLSLPTQELRIVRTARNCPRDDDPAVVAGALLVAAVELGLSADWSPPR
jgi:hypothetical protein